MKKVSFAIVGGGPAGFYTSKLLSKLSCNPTIHIIEKQLCPFGLIRYGVAPDHLSIKRAELTLSETASNPNFEYIGNKDVSLQFYSQLKDLYSGVIFAYGASGNQIPQWFNKIDPKADINFARDIVYWYNGHPSHQTTKYNLIGVHNVVIIGNGNVAIDVARIFLRDTQQLAKTEISQNALSQLKQSTIKTVQIIARRGVTNAAFALKEIRELHRIGIQIYAVAEELQDSLNEASYYEISALGDHLSSKVRMNKRKVNFIKDKVKIVSNEQLPYVRQNPQKKLILRFLMSPKSTKDTNILLCQKNYLQGEPFQQRPVETKQTVEVPFDKLIISTGFQVEPLTAEHYNQFTRTLRHSNGCVIQQDKIDIGKYAVGWCKNGPKGVIDETFLTCEETVNNLRIHLDNGLLKEKEVPNIHNSNTIPFQKYLQLREQQLKRGDQHNFVKKKLTYTEQKQFYGIQ